MSKGPDKRVFYRQQEPSQPMMQGAQAPVRMYNPHHHISNSHMQIRGAYQGGGQRVQYVPIQQQQEIIQQQYYQQQAVYGNNYQQYNVYQQTQGGYQPRPQSQQPLMFIQPGSSPNFMPQQMQPNIQTVPQQQQRQAPVFIPGNQIHHSPAQPPQQQLPHQPAETTPKKRTVIKITDPNSGKDLTSEILKKDKTPVSKPSSNPVKISAPVSTTPVKPSPVVATTEKKQDDSDKANNAAKANAAFAAQVLANLKKENPEQKTETPDVSSQTNIQENKESIKPILTKPALPVDQVDNVVKETETKESQNDESNSNIVPTKINEVKQENETKKENVMKDVKQSDELVSKTEKVEEVKNNIENEKTETKPEPVVSAENGDVSKTEIEASSEILVNGHEEDKAVPTLAKKKKGKKKDFDSKESGDILSAFTDPPKKIEPPAKPVEPTPLPKVDPTWEDKEKTIEKEIIRNEDAEEPESIQPPQQPRVEQVTIVNNVEADDDEKLQYDRDFLLKFQFAPICTSKPLNLPNIDIVLETAHQPTKPLVPGQKFANNDFMPNFMRQSSGGRPPRNNKRPTGSMGGKPQKVINMPQFEKVELKRSENAWVRPSDQDKELTGNAKEMKEVERNVRAILNKLTPQKFKTLVGTMTSLKIDSVEKLELANELIFEKAVSEPGFSVAYANMCRVLTDAFKSMPGNTNFRKILLNKCQKEFEKEKHDEIQMEEDRSKTFETEKEKKEWITELDYRELKNRRRTLGNIRFIGELFKLKMISEKIMHECIFKLLRTHKPESMEDHLECLCKLLSTIGKDLDHADAKPRMDQYFQQIEKIIEKKKISSRIKFALKDVIDLRSSHWIPRRDEGNPKTIDQIHREAQQKAKEEEMARQQEKLKPRERGRIQGGGGGRDSPSVRPNTSADGWTSVTSSKARGFAPTPVDASKFKIKKNDSSDISLGPGGLRPGAWSKGASGGSSSRSGSGSNTPTNEIEQPKANRFDLLAGSSETPVPADNRRGGSRSNSSVRKTSQGGNRRDERTAALRAVRDLAGTGSRTQSPVRSGGSSRNSPVSGTQTPVEPSVSPNPTPGVDEKTMRKKTKSTIEEFFSVQDMKEAILCIKELESPSLHYVFVEEVIVIATEKKPENRIAAGKLFCQMIKEKVLKHSEFEQGFVSVVEIAPDMAVDIPKFYQYLGEVVGPMIVEASILSLANLKKFLEPLVSSNKAGLVVAEAMNTATSKISDEDTMRKVFTDSGLSWADLLEKGRDVDEFIKDKKLEYTTEAPKTSHATQIQEQLLQLLSAKSDEKAIFEVIDKKVSDEERKSPEFIHNLTYVICKASIKDEGKNCTCDKDLLNNRKRIFLKYIDGNKRLELQAAFALQNLVAELNHPRGLLTTFFEEFYDGDIITEETFESWESSKECPDGKGVALSEVKDFLHWLKKAEEEPNEEETTPTN